MAVVAFLLVAGVAVGAALGLVLKRNAIHGALFLVLNLGSVAAAYLMLGFEFLAFAQIIVYAGAIMVLFVFAIMVLIPGKEETGPDPRRRWRLLAAPLGLALLVELGLVLAARSASPAPGRAPGFETGMIALFTDYLFPFELTSVLLLAAMVGVLVLAKRRA
ncbi:MAG: NADH-quinone oxidoreductase subunit J family protein [Candidatus Rokuibacteriota bacterium]